MEDFGFGYWATLFSGLRERQALNSAARAIQDLDYSADLLSERVRRLYALDQAQAKELEKLRTIVQVLAEQLVQMGADANTLAGQIRSAVNAVDNPDPIALAREGTPYRGGTQRSAQEPTANCASCNKVVLLRLTTITSEGTMCDACASSQL